MPFYNMKEAKTGVQFVVKNKINNYFYNNATHSLGGWGFDKATNDTTGDVSFDIGPAVLPPGTVVTVLRRWKNGVNLIAFEYGVNQTFCCHYVTFKSVMDKL